jgi:hypothetical protein
MKKYIVALIISLALVSCATNPNKIENQVKSIGKPGDVEITNIIVRWDFTATGDKPEQIYWRCDYLDANGFRVGEPERYVEATIYPEQPSSQTCSYPSQKVVDFRISFQNIATNMTIYN